MEKTIARKPLAYRLLKAFLAIEEIPKKGKNRTAGYRWQRAADVARAFRAEIFRRRILMTFDQKEEKHEVIHDIPDGPFLLVTITAEITFVDADEPSSTLGPFKAFGQSMDRSDKAIWKASTGLLKNFLKMQGLIPGETDDPEADESVDRKPATAEIAGVDRAEESNLSAKIAEFQSNAFLEACTACGKTKEQIDAYLQKLFRISKVQDLTKAQFNTAIRWAGRKPRVPNPVPIGNHASAANGHAQSALKLDDQRPAEWES